MKNSKLFSLIDKFATMVLEDPINSKYQAQRNMLAKFYEHFHGNLRAIINELGGDILVLRDQNFDPKMQKMINKVYQDIIDINKEIKMEKPYQAAEKFVKYVLDKPNKAIISNLDFLAKHHVKAISSELPSGKMMKHPQINSLEKLTALAEHAKQFMETHPLLTPINPVELPSFKETLESVPAFTAGKDELTRR